MQTTAVCLEPDRPIVGTATHLRGCIAARFPEQVMLHQHGCNGVQVQYSYPRVQYKILNGLPMIIGLAEGASLVETIIQAIECLNLAGNIYKIIRKDVTQETAGICASKELLPYSFLTPWLALNEENYEKYKSASLKDRYDLLRRILIGNILSMSKGLGYVVTEEIKISRLDVYPVKSSVRLKGVEMTGFKGTFSVNFDLPDYIGLGKSVSRGFGTIKRAQASERAFE